jgi:hypothetical protein
MISGGLCLQTHYASTDAIAPVRRGIEPASRAEAVAEDYVFRDY